MGKNQSFVETALGLEQAERSAEPPADEQASENGTSKRSRRSEKRSEKKTVKPPARPKRTFAIEPDIFKRLELTAVHRESDMSDLVNNALRAYLPKSIKITMGDDQGSSSATAAE